MNPSRRDALQLALVTGAAAVLPAPLLAAVPRQGPWQRGFDGQRRADLGDGRYLNPVIAGDHPDPTVLKDGTDYYATFTSYDYYPGLILWHSRDLLNWMPVGPALTTPVGSVFAPELVKHDGRYFLYFAALKPVAASPAVEAPWHDGFSIHVIHAGSVRGPWSEPVEIGVRGRYDPGHAVAPDGRRYLFLDDGYRVDLSRDGLSAVGAPRKVHAGWPIPQTMINEGFSLDSPKLIRRDGWYYMFSAEGGIGGPANGQMVVVARSRSLDGPWEYSPRTPLVRADARDDPWWSRGHATPVEGPDGRWWIVYSAFEKNLRSLGRPAILEPLEWAADGWPMATGGVLDQPLRAPAPSGGAHGAALSGPFQPSDLGTRLAFYRPGPRYRERIRIADGSMVLRAQGSGPADSSPLALIPSDKRFDIRVEIEVRSGAEAGLLLFYNDKLFCGLATDGRRLQRYKLGKAMRYPALEFDVGPRLHVRIDYKEDVAQFFISGDGTSWTRITTFDVSGYNHNMAGDFLSLRPALFVSGSGAATFRSLQYNGAI